MVEKYEHTQRGWFHYLLIALGLWMGVWAFMFQEEGRLFSLILLIASAVFFLLSLMFASLTVHDDGDRLRLSYGPLRFFGKSVPYDEVESVEESRTSFIDGWGIHWVPGRGWTYNLSGFDCALVRFKNKRVLRIGTDDREGLVRFLQHKVASAG